MRTLRRLRLAALALAFLVAPAAAWAKVTLIVSSLGPADPHHHAVDRQMVRGGGPGDRESRRVQHAAQGGLGAPGDLRLDP